MRDHGRRRRRMSGSRAYEVVKREHAAAVELNETRLETFGAPVFKIGLDRLDVTLEVVHMTVRRLCAVRVCHSFLPVTSSRPSMARPGCPVQPTSAV
jgi:hypothetical protein